MKAMNSASWSRIHTCVHVPMCVSEVRGKEAEEREQEASQEAERGRRGEREFRIKP